MKPHQKKLAISIRKLILDISYQAKVGHVGSAFSIIEILIALYFKILKINPARPAWINRDRFILSKGHAALALYAILYKKGFFSKKMLLSYCQNGGSLEEHPNTLVRGVEVSSGSLGHGLSIGAGMALGMKFTGSKNNVFVLLSDAECDEGQIWEAALFAAHHTLDNLFVYLDYNKVQAFGTIKEVLNLEPLKDKWLSFGFNVYEVDGHNIEELIFAFRNHKKNEKPTIFICHTVRGKGVPFMENKMEWHYLNPGKTDVTNAYKALKLKFIK